MRPCPQFTAVATKAKAVPAAHVNFTSVVSASSAAKSGNLCFYSLRHSISRGVAGVVLSLLSEVFHTIFAIIVVNCPHASRLPDDGTHGELVVPKTVVSCDVHFVLSSVMANAKKETVQFPVCSTVKVKIAAPPLICGSCCIALQRVFGCKVSRLRRRVSATRIVKGASLQDWIKKCID